jgi:hypothetical protein
MLDYPYKSIVLYRQPATEGWVIYGIRSDTGNREVLVTIARIVGPEQAGKWANELAKRLSGNYLAEEE